MKCLVCCQLGDGLIESSKLEFVVDLCLWGNKIVLLIHFWSN